MHSLHGMHDRREHGGSGTYAPSGTCPEVPGPIWDHLRIGDPVLAMKREGKAFYHLGRGADSKEGVMAFVEKRPARWSLSPSTDTPVPRGRRPTGASRSTRT